MRFWVKGLLTNRSTGKGDKREAKKVEDAARVAAETAIAEGERVTILQAIERTYTDKWQHNVSGEESKRQATVCAGLLEPGLLVNKITTRDVRKIKGDLTISLQSGSTVNRYLAAFRTVVRHMSVELSFVPPVFELLAEPEGAIRIYSREDEAELLEWMDVLGKPEIRDLFVVLLDTGLRLSEALGIDCYDEDGDLISARNGSLLTSWQNKGKKPRTIPLTSRAMEVLERRGTVPFPITKDHCETVIDLLVRRSGKPWGRPYHTCRHTTATRLLAKGVPIKAVQAWLGHSDIKTTIRYLHLVPGSFDSCVAALESF